MDGWGCGETRGSEIFRWQLTCRQGEASLTPADCTPQPDPAAADRHSPKIGGNPKCFYAIRHRRRLVAETATAADLLCAVWGPAGDKLAIGSSDGALTVWDVHSGRIQRTVDGCGAVQAVAWRPRVEGLSTHNVVLTAAGDTARHIHVTSGKQLACVREPGNEICSVAYPPSTGRMFATAPAAQIPNADPFVAGTVNAHLQQGAIGATMLQREAEHADDLAIATAATAESDEEVEDEEVEGEEVEDERTCPSCSDCASDVDFAPCDVCEVQFCEGCLSDTTCNNDGYGHGCNRRPPGGAYCEECLDHFCK